MQMTSGFIERLWGVKHELMKEERTLTSMLFCHDHDGFLSVRVHTTHRLPSWHFLWINMFFDIGYLFLFSLEHGGHLGQYLFFSPALVIFPWLTQHINQTIRSPLTTPHPRRNSRGLAKGVSVPNFGDWWRLLSCLAVLCPLDLSCARVVAGFLMDMLLLWCGEVVFSYGRVYNNKHAELFAVVILI